MKSVSPLYANDKRNVIPIVEMPFMNAKTKTYYPDR